MKYQPDLQFFENMFFEQWITQKINDQEHIIQQRKQRSTQKYKYHHMQQILQLTQSIQIQEHFFHQIYR